MSYKILAFIALLLTIAILFAVVVTGTAFLLTKNTQVFLWGGTSITGLCAVLGVLLQPADKKRR